MRLLEVFSAIAYKMLALVDIPYRGSNQHEINASRELRSFFDSDNRATVKWRYFADDSDILQDENQINVYDARARSASRTNRSEWRMYYRGDFLAHANPGDLLVFARTQNQQIYGLVFRQDSSWYRSARILFELQEPTDEIRLITEETLQQDNLEFVKQRILEELNIEFVFPTYHADEDLVTARFGTNFPTTRAMSEFAQEMVENEYGRLDPLQADFMLTTWLQREEELFRALERIIVGERLQTPFKSVDEFITFSLSVQNRRKSRMGYALQNHLSALFDINNIRYSAEAITEARNRPDFIFPGRNEYHDIQFDKSLLVMLAAKASCKDRWRQITTEAALIPQKHLCTLEPAISVHQTEDMRSHNITLVIPENLHSTYNLNQQPNLMTLTEFVDFVRIRQHLLDNN